MHSEVPAPEMAESSSATGATFPWGFLGENIGEVIAEPINDRSFLFHSETAGPSSLE